jgi:hypothetical protein
MTRLPSLGIRGERPAQSYKMPPEAEELDGSVAVVHKRVGFVLNHRLRSDVLTSSKAYLLQSVSLCLPSKGSFALRINQQ